MKRILTIVSVLSLVLASGAMAEPYGWSLSFSSTDPDVNAGAALPGFGTVYLWLRCTTDVDPGGAAAYGAHVSATGGAFIAGFTPSAGVLNAGNATDLLLAVGGCPTIATVIGSFTVVGGVTDLCMENAITVDCDLITPTEYASAVIGASAGGGVVCVTGTQCEPVSTEESSWGSIKGLYR